MASIQIEVTYQQEQHLLYITVSDLLQAAVERVLVNRKDCTAEGVILKDGTEIKSKAGLQSLSIQLNSDVMST